MVRFLRPNLLKFSIRFCQHSSTCARTTLSHRDIKPQNILFDKDWNVKIADFGYVCKSTDDEFRTTICGTSTYMAPEILSRSPYNCKSADVWSLGVTLYNMLTAKQPFSGDTKQARIQNIIKFNYCPDPLLSFKAFRLIKQIFRPEQYRIRLQDILQSDFCRQYESCTPRSIDFGCEKIELEASVLQTLSEEGIDIQRISYSVVNCKLDHYRALYFLTLKKQLQNEDRRQLSVFRKSKKLTKVNLSSLIINQSKNRMIPDPTFQQSPLPFKNLTMQKRKKCGQSLRRQFGMVQQQNVRKLMNTIDSPRKKRAGYKQQ